MSWVLFIIVLTVSFIIVRIGAIAFQLTGLEWSLAKFQSLSCFTGTGFTTKEAELITGNRQRRQIASVLMVLGNAGLVIMIASLAASFNPTIEAVITKLSKSFLPFTISPWAAIFINSLVIILMVYGIYRLFKNPKFSNKLTTFLKGKITKRQHLKPVTFEELAVATGGYGVSRIEIHSDSPIIDKALSESDLRKNDITILAIIRNEQTMPNPSANTKIRQNDELIAFGKLENIRKKICNTL
jgi:hypothetical protein